MMFDVDTAIHKGQSYIRGVDPEDLPADVVARAVVTATAAGNALGLPWLPTIVMYEHCGGDDPGAVLARGTTEAHGGRTRMTPHTEYVLIRAHLPIDLYERIVAHEVRHVWQGWQGWSARPIADLELDATQFEQAWMAEWAR